MLPVPMEELFNETEAGELKFYKPTKYAGLEIGLKKWDFYECSQCGFTCLFRVNQ